MAKEIDQLKLMTEAMYAYKESSYNRGMWLKQIGTIVTDESDTPDDRCKKVFDLLTTVGVRVEHPASNPFE